MPKKKPCDFCEEENCWTEDGTNGHALHIEVYPWNNVIGITSFGRTEIGELEEVSAQLEMNYCPQCGRKLI